MKIEKNAAVEAKNEIDVQKEIVMLEEGIDAQIHSFVDILFRSIQGSKSMEFQEKTVYDNMYYHYIFLRKIQMKRDGHIIPELHIEKQDY